MNLWTLSAADLIVGYAANALMMWVYPLPVMPRACPAWARGMSR